MLKAQIAKGPFEPTSWYTTNPWWHQRWPEDHRTVIRTLTPADQVKSVRLLGTGEVPFEQSYGALIVSLPDRRPTPYVNFLAIELNS